MKNEYNARGDDAPADYVSWNTLTCYASAGGFVTESHWGLKNKNHPEPIFAFRAHDSGTQYGNCDEGGQNCEKGKWEYHGEVFTDVNKTVQPWGLIYVWERDEDESWDHEAEKFTLSGTTQAQGSVVCLSAGDCSNCSE